MEKKMNQVRSIRLPKIMGPVDRWQGQCKPTDAYDRLTPSQLNDVQEEIYEAICSFYQEYIHEKYLVALDAEEPVLILICEYPNFEGYESTAFNLYVLEEKYDEGGIDEVNDHFRIPEPTHWEAGVGTEQENDE